MKRLDSLLVELKLAPSRSKAQQMIEAGEIEVQSRGEWISATRPSQEIKDPATVRVRAGGDTLKFVSRGGQKLEAALEHTALDVRGWSVLDVGLSTGGFADCLLQRGAQQIVGLDVGHAQIAEKLKLDSRLISFEGVHIRDLPDRPDILRHLSQLKFCTVDVSFISLDSVWPVLAQVLPSGRKLLALIKPQFEVGAANLDKKGIVRDEKLFADVQAKALHALKKYGFSVHEIFPCAVKGQDGNQEFFAFATRV